MVKLKVCGITSLDDARSAIKCGAQYLGFNFYPKSPRYITPVKAREIIGQLPAEIIAVGIFVNEPRPEDVIDLLQASGARIAQLHGDESPQYCAQVGAERVIKACRVEEDFDLNLLMDYPVEAVLFDASDPALYGGTGKTANWAIAHEAARLVKVFLAGGLSPDNIAGAIRAVKPFAVDLNSGVESSPGRKDHDKLLRLKEEIERL